MDISHSICRSLLCGLLTWALSGQVMHATGLMEDGYWNCVIGEKNLVCQGTRASYGALGCRPALNSPGLYFVFKCSIHLSPMFYGLLCAEFRRRSSMLEYELGLWQIKLAVYALAVLTVRQ